MTATVTDAVARTGSYAAPRREPVRSVVERLRNPMPTDRWTAWGLTALVTLMAFLIRLVNLRRPANLVFDETYYAKDAWALLHKGYELAWPDNANDAVVAGTSTLPEGASFIVHPPLGKWLIAAGEWAFGFNSFGWRIAACVFGSALVFVTIRLARRLTRSTLIGVLAGLLLSMDGLHFVMSRIALLDIFQAFFIVAAVSCMVADRDWFRNRLADHLERRGIVDLDGSFGPVLLWRPWRLAAGVLFGLAIGCKWNSAFALAAFCVLTLAWDLSARRMAGAGPSSWWGLLADGIPAFLYQVPVALAVYVATWSSWLATHGGWDRGWGDSHPDHPFVRLLGKPLGSLLWYHKEISDFHNGDFMMQTATHTYEAHPAGWLVVARTIGIDAVNDIKPGTQGCPAGGDSCLRVITGLGTPVLWWAAAAALVAGILWWIGGRDWRFSVPVVGALSTYVPWFFFADRPLFFFYAITIIPFTCIGLAMALGKILGPGPRMRGYHHGRRQLGAIVAGSVVALVVLNFAFLYPILTDQLMPRWQWALRMWFGGWI